jgi:microcystin-dependent protein
LSVIKYLDTATDTYKEISTSSGGQQYIEEGMPIGSIIMWYGQTLPTNWIYCNGQTLLKKNYPELFNVIMGASSTATQFTVPDLRARFPLGASSETGIGNTGGEETHTLTTAEMPAHTHSWSMKYGASTGTALPWGSSDWQGTWATSDSTQYPPLVIDSAGGDTAHNNMPPYFVIYYIMKASSSATLTTQEVQSKLEAL